MGEANVVPITDSYRYVQVWEVQRAQKPFTRLLVDTVERTTNDLQVHWWRPARRQGSLARFCQRTNMPDSVSARGAMKAGVSKKWNGIEPGNGEWGLLPNLVASSLQ